MFEVIELELF